MHFKRMHLLVGSLVTLFAAGAIGQPTPTPAASPTPETQQILEELKELQASTHDEMSLMVTLMGAFLALVTIGLAFLGFLGYQNLREVKTEGRTIKRLRSLAQTRLKEARRVQTGIQTEAEKTIQQAREAREVSKEIQEEARKVVQEAKDSSKQIQDMRDGMVKAFRDLEIVFAGLPDIESTVVVGQPAPKIAPEKATAFEDSDTILLVTDTLGIPMDPSRTAKAYLTVARYWRVVRQFARAHARLKRAIALTPGDATVHRHLGKTLLYWATLDSPVPEARSQRLAQAIEALEEARRLQENSSVLHDLAFAYDEKREFREAIELYGEARRLHRQEIASTGELEDWDFTYNLACSLARAKRFDEALRELEPILNKDDNWTAVQRDQDLDELRNTSPWSGRLREMLERTKPN